MLTATRQIGLDRLDHFLPRAGRDYARDRNHDLGPERRGNVSVLSPWLRYRLVTEQEVIARVLEQHTASAAEKYIQEVCWRTYWKGWLEMRPSVWRDFLRRRDQARQQLAGNSGLQRGLELAEAGQTGIEGFDDWARELVKTGYLHNHARMWFASIWIFTLKLPWVLGADFFLRHLLDADPASNTLSWRWVAGLQTVGKTYLATPGNIHKFTDGRFKPRGLASEAQALDVGGDAPRAGALPRAASPGRSSLDGAALLVHGEDLNPESLFDEGSSPPAALGLAEPLGDWPAGDKARQFLTEGLNDTAERMASRYQQPVERIDLCQSEAVIAWMEQAGVKCLVTPYAPVGPTADALDELAKALAAADIRLVRVRRPWDEAAWPHATKGFFPFKKQIPDLLRLTVGHHGR
ncbi:MAG: FAD-binding domain-containing protein [Wenzhouxiangella sp.]